MVKFDSARAWDPGSHVCWSCDLLLSYTSSPPSKAVFYVTDRIKLCLVLGDLQTQTALRNPGMLFPFTSFKLCPCFMNQTKGSGCQANTALIADMLLFAFPSMSSEQLMWATLPVVWNCLGLDIARSGHPKFCTIACNVDFWSTDSSSKELVPRKIQTEWK